MPPTDDDDAAGHHGGGPVSYVFKWLWNYRLSTIKGSPRSLWLFVASHILVAVVARYWP